MKEIPNFFIVGPPKCASTSLYHYLSQHPDIFLSKKKETHFFDLDYGKGIEYYKETYFSNTYQKVIGESTPTYSFLPYSIERIKHHFPNAKLIYCIRNPIDRAFSGWCMRNLRQGAENLSFFDALKENENQRKQFNLFEPNAENRWIADHEKSDGSKASIIRTYIDAGLYSEMLEFAYSLFPSKQIKIVMFEELANNIQKTLKDIFDFLEVDSSIIVNDLEKSNVFKKNYLSNILGRGKSMTLIDMMPEKVKKIAKKILVRPVKKPELTLEEKKEVYKYFKSDIEKLESLVDNPQFIKNWKY